MVYLMVFYSFFFMVTFFYHNLMMLLLLFELFMLLVFFFGFTHMVVGVMGFLILVIFSCYMVVEAVISLSLLLMVNHGFGSHFFFLW